MGTFPFNRSSFLMFIQKCKTSAGLIDKRDQTLVFVTLMKIHDISSDRPDLYKRFSDQIPTRSAFAEVHGGK